MMWGPGWGGWGWGDWIVGGVMMLAFWGLVIFGILALVRSTGRHPDSAAPHEDGGQAMRILDERFARGEIDADEYIRRRDLIHST